MISLQLVRYPTLLATVLAILVFADLAIADLSYKQQVDAEAKTAKAACEKFKTDFAPLEAEKHSKDGHRTLKQPSDIEKALALIIAQEPFSLKRTELRAAFFRNPKPTKTDVESYFAVDLSNCMFPRFSALARTVETAGATSDLALKEKTRAVLKRWFETNEKNAEGLVAVATSRILFERAVSGGVLKSTEKDRDFLKEIAEAIRTKSDEFAKRFNQMSAVSESELEVMGQKIKDGRIEDVKFDPVKMQKYLIAERDAAKSLLGRLKVWLAER